MSKDERRWLKSEIRKTLIPALVELGFEHILLTDSEKQAGYTAVYSHGRFRRRNLDGYDLLELALNKFGKASFVISAGMVPSEGITHHNGTSTALDVWSSWLPKNYVFYSVPALGRGFSLWHWPGRRIKQADIQTLIGSVVVQILPQIDQALRFDKRGANVKVFERN